MTEKKQVRNGGESDFAMRLKFRKQVLWQELNLWRFQWHFILVVHVVHQTLPASKKHGIKEFNLNCRRYMHDMGQTKVTSNAGSYSVVCHRKMIEVKDKLLKNIC